VLGGHQHISEQKLLHTRMHTQTHPKKDTLAYAHKDTRIPEQGHRRPPRYDPGAQTGCCPPNQAPRASCQQTRRPLHPHLRFHSHPRLHYSQPWCAARCHWGDGGAWGARTPPPPSPTTERQSGRRRRLRRARGHARGRRTGTSVPPPHGACRHWGPGAPCRGVCRTWRGPMGKGGREEGRGAHARGRRQRGVGGRG
jgi:hypothetical protein